MTRLKTVGLAAWLCLCASGKALAVADEPVKVQVHQEGQQIVVDLLMHTPASQRQAWAVLTDFAHMAEFVPNLRSSSVLESRGNWLKVRQQGIARHGFLSFDFDSLREIELTPYERINSRAIGGSLQKMEGVTQLIPDADGTEIRFHSVSVTGFWVPPLVGDMFVKHEIDEQFRAMLAEMRRRKQHAAQ